MFRSRLDQIIDMRHPLAKLAGQIDWGFLEKSFGAVYTDGPGQPPLPTRLMAGLAILKHMHDLSDEALCERWIENPYFQLFCGEEFFRHKLPFDRSSMTRWRQRMGEERLVALLQESLAVATKTGAVKPGGLLQGHRRHDGAAQGGDVPDRRQAAASGAREAGRAGQEARGRSCASPIERVGKLALMEYQRYAHAKQFKRANRALRRLRTYLGRVIRDIDRRIKGNAALERRLRPSLVPGRAACASSGRTSAARRSIRSTRRKSNASARARRTALRVRRQGLGRHDAAIARRAASSSPM